MNKMSRATRPFSRLAAVSLLIAGFQFAIPASALPIPVGTTAADDLIFNFDYTSPAIAPPPPYVEVFYGFVFPPSSTGTLTIDVFGDLNGSDFLHALTAFPSSVLVDGSLFDAHVRDGVFSLGLRLNSGAADLSGGSGFSFAIAIVCDTAIPPSCHGVQTTNVESTLGSADSVPEPATLALLGLGLAGLGFSRRRQ